MRGLAVRGLAREDRGEAVEEDDELEERGELGIESAAVLSAEGRGRRREEGARFFFEDIEDPPLQS